MNRWVSVLAIAVVLAVVSIAAQVALARPLGYDYHVINPVSQGLGTLIAFVAAWWMPPMKEAKRRVNFSQFTLYLTSVVVFVTALRLALHIG